MADAGTRAAIALVRRSFTVEEYHRMAAAGILGEDDRVELLEGEIVEMTAIGSRHAAGVTRLDHLLQERARGRVIVSVQNPVRLDERSEPRPDLLVLRPRPDFYASGHPAPADVLLLVEVADASVEADRAVKIPLYARAGIAEVWLVDLAGEAIEVFREPRARLTRSSARSAARSGPPGRGRRSPAPAPGTAGRPPPGRRCGR